MQADSGLPSRNFASMAEPRANNMLMQIQADALGIEVVRPKNAEATVLRAAYSLVLPWAYWPGKEAIASQWQMDRVFKPSIEPEERRECAPHGAALSNAQSSGRGKRRSKLEQPR